MSSPLADLIQRGESGSKSYDNYNRGTYTDGNGRQRIRGADSSIDFSRMTVGEVMDLQALPRGHEHRLFAVGRYQIIPATMHEAVETLGISRDERFSDALQDRLFSDYLITEKRPDIAGYITGKPGVSLVDAQLALAQEWASVANPATGRGYYGGANHASISAVETAQALTAMRQQYQQALADGQSPSQAWTDLHGQPARVPGRGAVATDPMSDGVLVQHERGEPVAALQRQLAQLGYTGVDGLPLREDHVYGAHTRHAVEAFQRDHGLKVDGKAGPLTLAAIDAVQQAADSSSKDEIPPFSLADAGHPDNARFAQALTQLEKLDHDRQLNGRPALFADMRELENAAGQLVFETKVAGMERIDAVLARADGSGIFAVQGQPGDPAAYRIYIDGNQACSQDLDTSRRQLEEFERERTNMPMLQEAASSHGMAR